MIVVIYNLIYLIVHLLIYNSLFCIGSETSTKQQIDIPPELKIANDEESFDEWKYLNGNTSIYTGDIGMFLDITCTASYPIGWELNQHWENALVRVNEIRRNVITNNIDDTFGYQYSTRIWTSLGNGSISGSITCKSIENNTMGNTFTFFVTGTTPIVSTIGIQNQTILCPTTDPTVETNLYRKDFDNNVWKIPSKYDPLKGFFLEHILPGIYTCNSSLSNQSFTIHSNQIFPTPNKTLLNVFDGEEIILLCESEDPVILNTSNKNYTISYILPNIGQIKLVPHISEKMIHVICNTIQQTYTWSINILVRPWIHFNQAEGEIDCISDEVDKSIATLRCTSPNDCRILQKCFLDKSCLTGDYYFLGNYNDASCTFSNNTYLCSSIRPSHRNGLVQCTVKDRYMTFEFFSGLTLMLRDDWKSASISEILRLDEVSRILYTNDTQYFFCETNPFIFDDGIQFSIKFKNGTMQMLQNGMLSIDESEKTTNRLVFEYNTIKAINVQLGIDVLEIYCFAPLRESYEWINVSRNFEMRHLTLPIIITTELKLTFIKDTKNQRITCETIGEPIPTVTWLRNGEELSPEFKTTSTTTGESFLEFPTIDFEHKGEYTCIASNQNGITNKTFSLKIELPSSDRTTLIIVIICGSIGFIILLGLLLYAWKRHQITKALLRQLTQEEVDEFLNGIPDHLKLTNTYANTLDQVQYKPYIKVYEIPLKDLCFDEKKILGSGAFGIVIKGRLNLNSVESDVAVKTTKPGAGIDVFKALLSELKIMMYIEKQENVISLIGACTEQIKDRILYIVIELCPLGNLESYLRCNRNAFVNHLQSGHIMKKEVYENIIIPKMSTLDLLNWSHQIASGMEFLQSKNVVHGDLATRNILLSETKIAKITDFGLSRLVYENLNYVKKSKQPLPWRWMALESLQYLEFSTKSDIWGYGIILYEMYTLGEIPWKHESYSNDFIKNLLSGKRLECPDFASKQIYDVMVQTWDNTPDNRPSFSILKTYFQSVHTEFNKKEE